MLDILFLFTGFFGEKCKEINAQIRGEKEYKRYMNLSVWDKARESHTLEINGHKYFWLEPHEIDISEAFWKSEKPLYDFLIDFYFERNWLPLLSFRVFLKSGEVVPMSRSEVEEEWRKRVEKQMQDRLQNTTLSMDEFQIKFYDMIIKENKNIEYYMNFHLSVNGNDIFINGGDMKKLYKSCPEENLAAILQKAW